MFALSVSAASSPVGQVAAHFNLSWATAAKIVTAVGTGGLAIDFLFPWVIPAVGTIQVILIAAGTGAAIGW